MEAELKIAMVGSSVELDKVGILLVSHSALPTPSRYYVAKANRLIRAMAKVFKELELKMAMVGSSVALDKAGLVAAILVFHSELSL